MTPLYQSILDYLSGGPVRMHMPGHKGKPLPVPELAGVSALDVTEIGPTGNLYEGGGPFHQAEELWARLLGAEDAMFLTGGSTQGIHTAMSLCARPGDSVLVDRGCHRAVYNAMALLDLKPVYLNRPWMEQWNMAGTIFPEDVENQLKNHPNIKTVCITSPTYCGLLSDVPKISHIVHQHGGRLVVDGAHGAHLPFLGVDCFRGADAVICSAHKTLPALGQSALLFTRGFDLAEVRRMAAVFGTSSPSYPVMISIDGAREWMETGGTQEYRRVARRVDELRRRFPSLTGDKLDPLRLTLMARDGYALSAALEQAGIWPEMADAAHVVLILTGLDGDEELDRLERALENCRELLGSRPPLPPPPVPEWVCSLRQALFAPRETRPLEECLGETAANAIAPYPPGVPVVAPGERISQKELAYLEKIGYNMREASAIIRRGSL